MSGAPHLWQRSVSLLVVMILLIGLFLSSAPVAAGAASPAGRSLREFLNPDGTLNLKLKFQGSVDARGWQLVSGADEPPRFAPLAANDHWDSRFAGVGVNGQVYALVRDSNNNVYVGGCFPRAGGLNVNYVTRWDGSAWSAMGTGTNGCVYALALDSSGNLYAGGAFTQAGGVAVNYVARWNGSAWSALGTGTNNYVWGLAVDSSNNVYAGGQFTTASGVTVNYVARWNGSAWSALGTGTNGTVYAVAVDSSNVYAGGVFTTAGGVTVNYIARWNGSAWSAMGTGANGNVRALLVVGSDLYVGGEFSSMGGVPSTTFIARWNGSAWFAVGTGINGNVYALAADSSGGNIYAGGLFSLAGGVPANYLARWNGSAWSALGGGGNSYATALTVDSSNNVYAGGGFNRLGGLYTGPLGRWDGSAWHCLGDGLIGFVNALVLDGSGNAYLGGTFDYAGEVTANHIIRWNGTSWSTLGSGVGNNVNALAMDSNGNLYAGGLFTTAGGSPAMYIARWNGSTWSALGTGMNSSVAALAVDSSNNVYAGGQFTTAGGVTVNYVARWNGSAWSALGTGMNSSVFALAVDSSNNVYAGGQFTTAGGVTANYVARWNGSAWSALGTGTNAYVRALLPVGTDLYAGGSFTQAGGVTVNFIARWNGSAWSALGSGVNASVWALARDASGNIYAGGDFTTASGVTVNYIARWNGSAWSALGSGLLNGSSLAIAAYGDNDLYTGGGFTMAGGKASSYFARWFNTAPVVNDDFYTTPEEVALNVPAPGVLGNDSDGENDSLTANVVTPPPVGSLTLNVNGSFLYTPPLDYFGVVTYSYQAADGYGGLGVGIVTITVTNVNDAPVAVDDSYATEEDVPLVVTGSGVLANDTDVDLDVLTATVATPPAHGALALNLDGSFVYTPTLNWNGSDSFIYVASDGELTDTATVHLTVNPANDAPTAADDVYTTTEDTVLLVAAPGVLENDTDVDGDPLAVVLIMPPITGTATLNADGSLVYTPTANWNGLDLLAYMVTDGALTDTAIVWIVVTPVNDAPVASGDAYVTDEDVLLVIAAPGVLENDTDIDGDPLAAELIAPPSNGDLLLNADGSFVYTPTLNWNGVDGFTYAASDGELTAEATVVITVAPVNDAPVAADDLYSTPEDTPLIVAAPGVLENDTDIDGDPLAVALGDPPTNGTVVLNADGSFTYTPTQAFSGPDIFTYIASDGVLTDTALVLIDVGSVDDPPIAQDDLYSTPEDTPLVVAAPGVLENDVDPEGSPLMATLGTPPSNGTVAFNADGSFTYTPTQAYSGADTFTYIVSDGALTDTALVLIDVGSANDPPIARDDTYATDEDTVLTVTVPGVLANDIDPEGSPLSAAPGTSPAHGVLVLNADGSFSYAPEADWNGVDSFTYIVSDGELTATGTVQLTVNPINDAPVAVGEAYTATADVALVIGAPGVLGNDSDVDGDPLTAVLDTSPFTGTLTLNADGSFTYTPAAGFVGVVTFTYHANDGTDESNVVTVTITVEEAPSMNWQVFLPIIFKGNEP